MFGNRRKGGGSASGNEEILGFLGEGTILEGDLNLQGGFRVDGKIHGRVRSEASLVIGPKGEIVGDEIRASEMTVSGMVKGNLHIAHRLDILSGGKVIGHVVLGRRALRIDSGGLFEGTVSMPDGEDAKAETTGRSTLVEEPASA
jgi:cytoskeletal protein CcmA (bactofilin family)